MVHDVHFVYYGPMLSKMEDQAVIVEGVADFQQHVPRFPVRINLPKLHSLSSKYGQTNKTQC